jgi:hypothetical protein
MFFADGPGHQKCQPANTSRRGSGLQILTRRRNSRGVTEIIKICAALKLEDVEKVMKVDPERPDIRVPIPNL